MLGARWLSIAGSYRSAVNSNSLAILPRGSGRFKTARCESLIALTPKPAVERLAQEHGRELPVLLRSDNFVPHGFFIPAALTLVITPLVVFLLVNCSCK